jgi:hypothetical protein
MGLRESLSRVRLEVADGPENESADSLRVWRGIGLCGAAVQGHRRGQLHTSTGSGRKAGERLRGVLTKLSLAGAAKRPSIARASPASCRSAG